MGISSDQKFVKLSMNLVYDQSVRGICDVLCVMCSYMFVCKYIACLLVCYAFACFKVRENICKVMVKVFVIGGLIYYAYGYQM